jgi:predicted CxxxxCH...CXXCH cytochrome family protein
MHGVGALLAASLLLAAGGTLLACPQSVLVAARGDDAVGGGGASPTTSAGASGGTTTGTASGTGTGSGTTMTTWTTTGTGTGAGTESHCSGPCHGTANANPAPPLSVSGEQSTAIPQVGAHQKHYGDSPWHRPVECSECHTLPTQVECPAVEDPLHCDGVAEIVWGPLALTASTVEPAYGWDAPYPCTNVYCHGATLEADHQGQVTTRVPAWTAVGEGYGVCGAACHSLPPGADHVDQLDCETCHSLVVAAFNPDDPAQTLWLDPGLHIDGTVEVIPPN